MGVQLCKQFPMRFRKLVCQFICLLFSLQQIDMKGLRVSSSGVDVACYLEHVMNALLREFFSFDGFSVLVLVLIVCMCLESGSHVIAMQNWIYNAWNCRPRLIEACFFMLY